MENPNETNGGKRTWLTWLRSNWLGVIVCFVLLVIAIQVISLRWSSKKEDKAPSELLQILAVQDSLIEAQRRVINSSKVQIERQQAIVDSLTNQNRLYRSMVEVTKKDYAKQVAKYKNRTPAVLPADDVDRKVAELKAKYGIK